MADLRLGLAGIASAAVCMMLYAVVSLARSLRGYFIIELPSGCGRERPRGYVQDLVRRDLANLRLVLAWIASATRAIMLFAVVLADLPLEMARSLCGYLICELFIC